MNIQDYPVSTKATKNNKELIKEAVQVELDHPNDQKGMMVDNLKARQREQELIAEGHSLVSAAVGHGGGKDASVDRFWSNKEWTRLRISK